jgi:cobalamin synthase
MRKAALFLGTSIVLAASLAAMSFRAWAAIGTVLLVSAGFGIYCRRRIAGITGDTLGANLELCESVSLLAYLWT